MSSHDRQRGLQLVARVVDEAPLRRKCMLEPVEHLIERGHELRHLVAPLDGNPATEVAFRDRARRTRQRRHGPHDAVGEPPCEQRAEQQHCEPDGRSGQSRFFGLLRRPVAEDRRDEHSARVPAHVERHREVLDAARRGLHPAAFGLRE